jgi:hypothetical protein
MRDVDKSISNINNKNKKLQRESLSTNLRELWKK